MVLCGGDCLISILRTTIRNTGAVLNSSVLYRRVARSQSVLMNHSLALFSVIQSLMFLLTLHYACSSELSAISWQRIKGYPGHHLPDVVNNLIKINIGNQSTQSKELLWLNRNKSISIANCYRSISAINSNKTCRNYFVSIAIDWQKLLTISDCFQEYRLVLIDHKSPINITIDVIDESIVVNYCRKSITIKLKRSFLHQFPSIVIRNRYQSKIDVNFYWLILIIGLLIDYTWKVGLSSSFLFQPLWLCIS